MRKYIILTLSFIMLFCSCSVLKKNTDETKNGQETSVSAQKTEKPLTEKQKQKQKEKQIKENRKKQLEENKRRDKEFAKKKKQEEKEKKRKEKEQDKIIKNAAIAERQRMKEERKREKESLLSSQKLEQQEIEMQKKMQQELEKQKKQLLEDEKKNEEISAKQEKELEKQIQKEEQELAEQEKRRIEQENKEKEEQRKKEVESMSTMDQIIYRMQQTEEEENTLQNKNDVPSSEQVTTLSDKEKKKIIASKENQKGNVFKCTYQKLFPKKELMQTAYAKLYKEKPLTVMIASVWNRSNYKQANEMAYTAAVKELCEKGYYVLPAMSFMDILKKDTTINTRYITGEQIKSFKEKYNADAVLLMTIYRVEKPWWSTNINVVAHYDLISTKSLDTLFVKHADFNYDSPMPVKEKNNKKLLKEPEQILYLGLFEYMQRYVFWDLPHGPYHKDYEYDKNRKAQNQEVKYKVSIKPS